MFLLYYHKRLTANLVTLQLSLLTTRLRLSLLSLTQSTLL